MEKVQAIRPVAPVKSIVFRSPSPAHCFCANPGICVLERGRLIVTMDFADTPPVNGDGYRGQLFISDDRGTSWKKVLEFPFMHEIPFVAGNVLYVLGHVSHGGLRIIRSNDEGETWSDPVELTSDEYRWHQSSCNVCYVEDRVYLVMEYYPKGLPGWNVRKIKPVLMRANVKDDLTRPESWTFAETQSFEDFMKYEDTDYFGVPFYSLERDHSCHVGANRYCAPIGWLESNVVHIEDEKHIWYDPSGRTFHLFMRAHTGRTGYCCVVKVMEQEDGTMKTELVKSPSGKKLMYMPMPGGQMKFYILYDRETKTYWLLSTQATDSMIKPECMPDNRFGLPDNERHRLQLHFSKNCVDWCFACLVDMGETALQSRHYASMNILEDDLYIVSRSGDHMAQSAHNANMITLHEIKNFRELIY